MRIRRFAAALAAGAMICVAAVAAQDALTAIGLRPDQGKGLLFDALREGRVPWQSVQAPFKAATSDARAVLITGVLAWAKQYTDSAEFGKRYVTARSQAEPRMPGNRKWTADEELTRRQTALDRRIEMEKKRLADPPSPRQTAEQQQAQRKSSEERLEGMVTERARYNDPVARAELRKPFEAEEQRYREDHAKWEQQFPADSRAAIANRLRQFLAVSGTVDFAAQLIPCLNSSQKHTCFADPIYEKQSAEWKLCYRVGRQPLEAARTLATNWLSELEKR